ncbi:hypothetical protein V8C26DRAFT_34049 [Trichoderma gracile]
MSRPCVSYLLLCVCASPAATCSRRGQRWATVPASTSAPTPARQSEDDTNKKVSPCISHYGAHTSQTMKLMTKKSAHFPHQHQHRGGDGLFLYEVTLAA